MNLHLFRDCCLTLTYAATTRLECSILYRNKDRDVLFLNLFQTLSLGTIGSAWYEYTTKKPFKEWHFSTIIFIPSILSLGISGLKYIAQKRNYCAQEMETLEKKFGKWTDIIARIGSVALVVLLISQAKKDPFCFGCAFLATGIELGIYLRELYSPHQRAGSVS